MKKSIKIGVALLALVSFGSSAQAWGGCDTVEEDPCSYDNYSIVEVEPDIYWPHEEMPSAHYVGYKFNEKKVRTYRRIKYRSTKYRRTKKRRSFFSCSK